jgi:Mannosyltransferase OCH1 and related enzymes
MIPKVIHYCWFGGNEKSEMIKRCMASWKKFCPDYEIVEWNESNYDVSKQLFMKKAYEAGKWAFVTDYARVDILYHYGGIYLDTDVELISSLDPFLKYNFYAGFESISFVSFGLGFGSVGGHSVLKDILDYYDRIEFPNNEFGLTMASCPRIQTDALKKRGMVCNNETQVVDGCHIFSTEYFCPMSFQTGETRITDKTISIHHFDMSWKSDNFKKSKSREWNLVKILGPKWGKILFSLVSFPGKLYENAKGGTLVDYIRFLMKEK